MKPEMRQVSKAAFQSFVLSHNAELLEEIAVASTKPAKPRSSSTHPIRRPNREAGAQVAIAVLPVLPLSAQPDPAG